MTKKLFELWMMIKVEILLTVMEVKINFLQAKLPRRKRDDGIDDWIKKKESVPLKLHCWLILSWLSFMCLEEEAELN